MANGTGRPEARSLGAREAAADCAIHAAGGGRDGPAMETRGHSDLGRRLGAWQERELVQRCPPSGVVRAALAAVLLLVGGGSLCAGELSDSLTATRLGASSYAPRRASDEEPAFRVALNGNAILAQAVLLRDRDPARSAALLEQAFTIALSLAGGQDDAPLSVPERPQDMDGDGRVGWGRFWAVREDDRKGSRVRDGGYTYFPKPGCKRNQPYATEMFDSAFVIRHLLDVSLVMNRLDPEAHKQDIEKLISVARSAVDDTWNDGALVDGRFYYWKTAGECERDWFIKNTSLLFGVNLLKLYYLNGDVRSSERAGATVRAEEYELERGNYGYYGVLQDQGLREVAAHQERKDHAGSSEIVCLSVSCLRHLPIEALALNEADQLAGADHTAEILRIMARYGEGAAARNSAQMAATSAAYFCNLREMDSKFRERCLAADRSSRSGAYSRWAALAPAIQAEWRAAMASRRNAEPSAPR